MQTNPKEQRRSFVNDYESGQWSMSELCERYGVSRPTGYKWIRRVEAEAEEGLGERSRAPKSCPHRTSSEIEQRILEARWQYGWGAKKLLQVLSRRHPQLHWPARSTVNEILDRHGALHKNRRRKKWKHPGAARLTTSRANETWSADFKGQFKTIDGRYCYPLTVSDHYSRSLLLCKGLLSVKTEGAKPAFRGLFRALMWLAFLAAAAAGACFPPITVCMRTYFRQTFADDALLSAAYSAESVLIEVIFIIGPMLVALFVAFASAAGAVWFSAACAIVGTLLFMGSPALRHWRIEARTRHSLLGPLANRRFVHLVAIVLCFATAFGFLEIGITAYAIQTGDAAFAGILLGVALYRDPDAALAKRLAIPDGYSFHGEAVHYPALVLIDPQGNEAFRYVGKNNTDRFKFDQLSVKLEELLPNKSVGEYNLPNDRLAIGGYDPVAYYTEGQARKGAPALRARYRGVNYQFASQKSLDQFLAEPGRFVPTYGGWCATAMAKGEKVEIDPTNFKVSNGRLFLFYKGLWGNARKDWDKDEPAQIGKADAAWKRIANE